MAYGLKKISPLDLKPSTAVGVALPFQAENVFTSVYTTKDQTKYNIINFLLTNPKERVYNPAFGAGLRSKLFQQIDRTSFEEMQQSIITQLDSNFPQIEIVDFNILGDPDTNTVNIKFSYRLKRSNESDNVTLVIQTM